MLHVSASQVLVTTTETMPGYHIEQILGPVVGVAARTRSPYVEGLKSLADGHGVDPDHRRELLIACRLEAITSMLGQASGFGANAVVAMRFDHRNVTDLWNEVCAYGTAVWVVPANIPSQMAAPSSAAGDGSVR